MRWPVRLAGASSRYFLHFYLVHVTNTLGDDTACGGIRTFPDNPKEFGSCFRWVCSRPRGTPCSILCSCHSSSVKWLPCTARQISVGDSFPIWPPSLAPASAASTPESHRATSWLQPSRPHHTADFSWPVFSLLLGSPLASYSCKLCRQLLISTYVGAPSHRVVCLTMDRARHGWSTPPTFESGTVHDAGAPLSFVDSIY